MFLLSCVTLATNGLGLGEEGELKVQMLNKPQMFIELQMLNLALLPLFRQTLVMCRLFCQVVYHIRPKRYVVNFQGYNF